MQPARDPLSDPWQTIVNLLHALPPNGLQGFEGFVAIILEAVTGKPFLIANTGRQPSGDAIAVDATISLQAKRYGPQATVDANRVAADFLSVCDAVGGRLDVYVVAVTRESAQLRRELETVERRTGVDIVVLADERCRPELSALCVAYWPRLKAFFPNIPTPLEAWIVGAANDTTVQDVVERTRAKLGTSLNTFLDLQRIARAALVKKFRSPTAQPAEAGVHIALGNAVERKAPRTAMSAWWQQAKEPCAYLSAQEGCGKSWVAADFAEQLAAPDTGPAVLWLESLDWSGCDTLEALVAAGLRTVLPEGDARAGVFAGKIFRLWPRPVLLILDGVNEQGCLESAQQLLRLYNQHAAHYASHLRLLFTTRPLKIYAGFRPGPWQGSRCIALGGFTDPEFDEAVRRNAPEVDPALIPQNVREFAAVPRFFRIALRLKEKLRGLGQLTKSVLLFADLIDKIEHDLQSRRLFASGPEATLAHLARHSQRIDAHGVAVSHQHLTDCFPNLAQALEDLKEQRIVLDRQIGMAILNLDHVVLGFALHLLHLAEANPGDSESTLRDRLALALEPNREDDHRTEALYVALLLSLVRDPPAGQSWQAARRALLTLWCGGHNAQRTAERLSFWARADLAAYRRVVETLFTRYLSGDQDTALITPIALRWRETGSADSALAELLTDWLTRVFPGVEPDDSPEDALVRASFPAAETHQQLRLAFAAISVLSLRPEDQMLPALVRCARSCSLCRAQEMINGKPHDLRLKTPYENLGILLRWNYTDTVVPKLIMMANEAAGHAATIAGLRTLAECLDLVEIPPELRRPEPPFVHERPDESSAKVIKDFRHWIHHLPSAQIHWPGIWHLELLVEDTAAELDARDLDKLGTDLSRVVTGAAGAQVGRDDVAELFPHLFPWFARFAPAAAQRLAAEYWHYALRGTNPTGAAMDAPVLPLGSDVLAALIVAAREAAARNPAWDFSFFLTRFSKLFLLSGNEDLILNWFDAVVALPAPPDADDWQVLPLPLMLHELTTPRLARECWTRFERAADEHRTSPGDRRVIYWLELFATLVRQNASAGRQALGLVRTLLSPHPWAVALLEIVAASNDSVVIEEALLDPDVRQHFANPSATHAFGWFLNLPEATPLTDGLRRVLPELPPSIGAELLHLTDRPEDHLSFARLLAESALRRATNPANLGELGYVMSWTRDHDERRAWWHLDPVEPGSRTHHSDLSAVWGVDRGRSSDWGAAFADDNDAAFRAKNVERNAAIKRGFEQMTAIAEQYLVRSRAEHILERWARLQPAEFREFAGAFFATLAQHPGGYFELSLFCDDVLDTFCAVDVTAAAQLHEEFFGARYGSVWVNGLIPSFVHRLMDSDLDRQGPGITPLRLRVLDRCRSDRDLLGVIMAALHGGTLPWLRHWARDVCGVSPLAKERTLAVTVFAFAETAEDRPWLATVAATDPSAWVREHAAWAGEVHDQAAAARRLWDETAAEVQRAAPDLLVVATRLVRLQPLLPPTAIYWPRPKGTLPAANALVTAFWYAWQNRGGTKAENKIGGRKLAEYFRGQKLGDVTKRVAPWWEPESPTA